MSMHLKSILECIAHSRNNDNVLVTWALWRLKSPTIRLFVQQHARSNNNENIEAPHWCSFVRGSIHHYNDVIMSAMASQITSLTIVYSTVYSGADQSIHQNSASLAFVRGIHRWMVNSKHKGSVMRKMFPVNDVIIGGGYPSHRETEKRFHVLRSSWRSLKCPFQR